MSVPVVTVSSPGGARLAEITITDGRARVDPPAAAAHPLVAAVAAQLEATAARPRPRTSC